MATGSEQENHKVWPEDEASPKQGSAMRAASTAGSAPAMSELMKASSPVITARELKRWTL